LQKSRWVALHCLDDLTDCDLSRQLPTKRCTKPEDPPTANASKVNKHKAKRKRNDTKALDEFHDTDFETTDESSDERAGGIRKHPLLLKISRPYRVTDEQRERNGYGKGATKRFRCLASKGCKVTWKRPRDRQRVLKHAQNCDYLPADLRREVVEHMAGNAVGPKAEIIRSGSRADDEEPDVPAKGKTLKRAKTDPSIPCGSSRATDLKNFVREGKKNLQNASNHALLSSSRVTASPQQLLTLASSRTLSRR